jgi:hydroxypyruvate isomerase
MLRLAANLTLQFGDGPFLDRFERAARCGFRGVEYIGAYDQTPEALAQALRETGLEQVLFNLPPGDWAAGERGLTALPGREAAAAAALHRGLEYARATGAKRLHVMAGIIPPGADLASVRATYSANLRLACDAAAKHGIMLVIEPINPRDMPGYFLTRQQQAAEIISEVQRPNLGLLMDFYHCQIVEGDLTRRFAAHLPLIRHLQLAGVPDRAEPDDGEVAYDRLLQMVRASGYDGWIGCEYRPRHSAEAGLGWAEPWLKA